MRWHTANRRRARNREAPIDQVGRFLDGLWEKTITSRRPIFIAIDRAFGDDLYAKVAFQRQADGTLVIVGIDHGKREIEGRIRFHG